MTKISQYALLLSLSYLTSVPVKAEVITTGEKLAEIISNNQTGTTVTAELGNDITLPGNLNINGNVNIDGTENKFKINGNNSAGFVVDDSQSLLLKNTTLNGFGGTGNRSFLVENKKGGSVVLENADINGNNITATSSGDGALLLSGNMIRNYGNLSVNGNVSDNTIGNSSTASFNGGLIYNSNAIIENISGTFERNTLQSTDRAGSGGWARGTVLYQGGGASTTVNSISGAFNQNKAFTYHDSAQGGVMYINQGEIKDIHADFTDNTAESHGSYVYAQGGVIYNKKTIGSISGTFKDNKAVTIENGAKTQGGAIYNNATIGSIKDSLFSNNYTLGKQSYGGAIYSSSTISEIVNTSFLGNHADSNSASDDPRGGAIYSSSNLTIKANDGSVSEFSGNYVQLSDGSKTSNAIYMASKRGIIGLNATNEGSIVFNDAISGISGYTISITGDETGRVAFNNKIENAASVTSENVTLALGKTDNASADLTGVSLTVNSGVLDLQNDAMQTINVGAFSSTADTKLKIDADLASGESDRIAATSVATGSKININNINILNDGRQDIVVFENGNAPDFANLDSFAAYTADYSYTFKSDSAGILSTDLVKKNLKGFNAAIGDEDNETRSYTLSDGQNVFDDLGELKGGENAVLTLNGNGNTLNGTKDDGTSSYAGMTTVRNQKVTIDNVASVENFASENGGFIKSSGELNISNSSFKNNSAVENGGAVWSDNIVNVSATNGNNVEFSGNTANGVSNAIYMADATSSLNLIADGGNIVFNDGIDGVNGYTVNISGTDQNSVSFNQSVSNVGNININSSHVYLDRTDRLNGANITLNGGNLHFDNGVINNGIAFGKLTGGNGTLHIDVDTLNQTADQIAVQELTGTVNVVAYNIGGPDNGAFDKTGASILFARVTEPGNGKFRVLRVENSAYEWLTDSNVLNNGSTEWLMSVRKTEDGKQPVVVAEAAGYMGLTAAGFEQTRGMIRNIEAKTAASMIYIHSCGGYYDNCYNREPLYNLWISPVYASSSVDAPVKLDADIYGFEAGGDLQQDAYNRFGVFASYRHGKYDLDGKNDFYAINTAGDIDIDSYIGGLYYRYTDRRLWSMATVFGGIQKADLKTDDGVKTDSDAVQLGAALNAGYAFMLSDSFAIEPRAGINYTRITWDDIHDRYGKTAKFDNASQFELEAGIKFEKTLTLNAEPAKFYIQPGILQIYGSGDKVTVSGLNTVHTLDDMTLGSIKGGVSYRVNNRINVFGNLGYLYGSDYENLSANIGLNYAF